MATRSIESAYSYEGISNQNLKAFLGQSVEPRIQEVLEWPIQTSRVPMLFSSAFGLGRFQLFNIINTAGRDGLLDLVRHPKGKGNGIRYSLDQDGVRIIAVLSWEFKERGGKKNTLRIERIGRVAEALGKHPLREKLNFSLLLPNSSGLSLSPSHDNSGDAVPIDPREIIVQSESRAKPSLVSVPHIDEKELEKGRFWTLAELEKLLPHIPEGWEAVSSERIPQLFDGHPKTDAVLQMIMFSSAAWAKDPRERSSFNELLAELNNDQLRFGIKRCIFMLGKRPDIKNLVQLFQRSVKWVQKQQETKKD
ncbi:hypothetical protein HYS96_03635 [Candidatus Daviesbacteria bacterium]|nr:hypothetical protein [Candidatus Daviesbacteria bacterium]